MSDKTHLVTRLRESANDLTMSLRRRDETILEAHRREIPIRQIAEAVGLPKSTVSDILRRTPGYKPRRLTAYMATRGMTDD
jgi:DNA-binding Lrp family transcriptional regulator